MNKKIIEIKELKKIYNSKNSELLILENINFEVSQGDIISIVGPSGCGKSTFLNIIGMLDSNYQGIYEFLSKNIKKLSNNEKNIFRNQNIGFVHQFFHLIPELSVLENVALPNMIFTKQKNKSLEKANFLIKKFGLKNRTNFKPLNLSGGEQQRISIARALINNPQIIIADEMTGNLDEETSDYVFKFFLEEIKKNKQSLIYVTHNEKYAEKANKRYKITKKQIIQI